MLGFSVQTSELLSNRITVGAILSAIFYVSYSGYLSRYLLGYWIFSFATAEIISQIYFAVDINRVSLHLANIILFSHYSCSYWFYTLLSKSEIHEDKMTETIYNICLVNIFSDIAQYFGGKVFGRTLVFPHISPKKTLEGYIIGTISSLIFSSIIGVPNSYMEIFTWLIYGYLGGMVSSALKRELEIKDWSRFLGNHGGFADRTDSLVLPICLYIFRFITIK